jgi:hypothetical protein
MPDTPTTLWLTDRSRFKTGFRCPRARYLGSHFGPTGYGITLRADSLPLATGTSVHEILEGFAAGLIRYDSVPTLEATRAVIQQVQDAYVARVEARGFRGILGGETTEETVKEQRALIAGLGWAVRLRFLPWFHEQYRLLASEQERLHLLGCTCGAGPLDEAEHLRRGCAGPALMIRTDLLAQRRGASTLAYFEAKTTGWESDAWSERWETDPQLGLGTLDVEKKYGAEVTELYVLGLNKGARRKDKYDEPPRKKQMSALCYGYCRPGNPPLASDDWLPGYEWINEAGETKRASRQHKRRGVWELPQSDWPTWLAYHQQDPAMPPEEFWTRFLPPTVLDKVCFVLGPMNRQDHQIAAVRRAMAGEEARAQAALWALYEAQERGVAWASPEYQALLDTHFPQSWECRPFGKEHQCEFVGICHREIGWEDPLGTGRYVPRRPHHQPELDQAVARGLLEAEAQEVEESEA